jgi:hypothetical protein
LEYIKSFLRLAHMLIEIENSHNLPCASRKASGVVPVKA